MTVKTVTRSEIRAEIQQRLSDVNLTWEQLDERASVGNLTPEEWEAWDRIDNLKYLLR